MEGWGELRERDKMSTERSREEGRLPMGALCKSEMVSSPLSRCSTGPGYQAWQIECRLEFSPLTV